ncbi:xanthine dehydrogenase accessory protein XdhC [Glutamicibacter soli]|uniref:Xanthine dehydrogenase accessory protein XdhC n=1 Tax=Glutamicibacter soli TaxID=453836 RepID=A0A6L9FZD6_9MICC|nr:xanthine dehydrogenase accessory protein XdhC [Glutamicibacter soli]
MEDLARLRAQRIPAVLATVVSVRGHTPREAGAKFVVTDRELLGTIGGGNMEMLVAARARQMLASSARSPEQLVLRLNDKAAADFGRQCCGGEAVVLLEPVPARPVIAVFGIGHVGLELAHILARHDVELVLCDARAEQLAQLDALAASAPPAVIRRQHAVLGEQVMAELPDGSLVLIMTHDHAEDFHLCDAALRRPGLGYVGLIGSAAKYARFTMKLADSGHERQDIARITCPIGLPGIPGKQPAAIAVSVAADLLARLALDAAPRSQDVLPI